MATVDLNTPLNLEMINARTRNSEYNPSRFHGVVMRLREPRTTALIFRSGKSSVPVPEMRMTVYSLQRSLPELCRNWDLV